MSLDPYYRERLFQVLKKGKHVQNTGKAAYLHDITETYPEHLHLLDLDSRSYSQGNATLDTVVNTVDIVQRFCSLLFFLHQNLLLAILGSPKQTLYLQ